MTCLIRGLGLLIASVGGSLRKRTFHLALTSRLPLFMACLLGGFKLVDSTLVPEDPARAVAKAPPSRKRRAFSFAAGMASSAIALHLLPESSRWDFTLLTTIRALDTLANRHFTKNELFKYTDTTIFVLSGVEIMVSPS